MTGKDPAGSGGQSYARKPEKTSKTFVLFFTPFGLIHMTRHFGRLPEFACPLPPDKEKKTMFHKKRLFVPAALILTSFFGVSAANAQDSTCAYTLASLQGSFAVLVNYGANVALGLQIQVLDGKGNLTRTGVLNQPTAASTTGARTVGTVTSVGTYTVNCNGTGTITRLVTKPDGSTAPAVDDFIVTESIKGIGRPSIATTIVDAQRDPSVILPGGVFVTRVHTRLPDTPVYN